MIYVGSITFVVDTDLFSSSRILVVLQGGFCMQKHFRYYAIELCVVRSCPSYGSQMVRCVILNLANESNGRHIELSLRPSVVNKGMSLSQLTPGCGVYGSVVSCEDHGYVMSLGLEGVTAFLPSKDAPSTALKPGQPVEAVVKVIRPLHIHVTP